MTESDQHREHRVKGGRIGGPLSPTNFRNNPSLAAEAGKRGKRGRAKVYCPWCDQEIERGSLEQHTKTRHRSLHQKYFIAEEDTTDGPVSA